MVHRNVEQDTDNTNGPDRCPFSFGHEVWWFLQFLRRKRSSARAANTSYGRNNLTVVAFMRPPLGPLALALHHRDPYDVEA